MLFYPAALPLSRQTLTYTARIIRRHRAQIGSPWRKLTPSGQALLVLAYLRKGETFAELAAGFGIGTATAWRYVSVRTQHTGRSTRSSISRTLARSREGGTDAVRSDRQQAGEGKSPAGEHGPGSEDRPENGKLELLMNSLVTSQRQSGSLFSSLAEGNFQV
jgi:hypothetical protein